MFTVEILKESSQFKSWIGKSHVSLIHNVYYDSKDDIPSYIVIHTRGNAKWDITRFFMMGEKIQVSSDYTDLASEEVFEKLLSDYSSGL